MAVVTLSAAALFSACQKDEANSTVTLTAIADDTASGSKAYVYNNYLCWHNTDDVKVNNVEHTITASTSGGETSATASITDVDYNENGYVAAYPASSVKTMGAGVDGDVTISVPVTQTYTTLTTANNVTAQVVPMPMVGRCSASSGTLKFHNAASLVKVTINNPAGKSLKLHQIILSARDASDASKGVIISGYQKMTSTDESISPNIDADTMVTLDCSSTLPFISNVSDYYLVVAPFCGKLMVRVLAVDESSNKYIFTKISTASQSISRNKIGSITINLTDNGETKSFWGSGTAADPYLITNAADLNTFKGKLSTSENATWNKNTIYYLQTADIDVSASSWSSSSKYFYAHYDGGGHSIKLALANGGFVERSYGGEFKNLELLGSYGSASGGAFCNSVWYGSTRTKFKNCINRINVGGDNKVGGFVGTLRGGATLEFNECINYGTVTGTSNTGYVGGLLGYILEGYCIIDNCTNELSASIQGVKYCGGMVGGSGAYTVEIKGNVTNRGNVTKTNSSEDGTGFGGVCGYTGGDVIINEYAVVTNYANITATVRTGTGGSTGGLVGLCKNFTCNGTAVNDGTISSKGAYVGGIVGNVSTKIIASNCTNKKSISGDKFAIGGIVGTTTNADISSCWNEGTVSGNYRIGGIVGSMGYGCISKCGNTKTIEGSGAASDLKIYDVCLGGIVGYCYTSSSGKSIEVYNCYNSGKVNYKGSNAYGKAVGGIVGYIYKDDASCIHNCYNKGTIVSSNTNSGGILGEGLKYKTAATFSIKNCYSNTTSTFSGSSIASIVSGTSEIENCYVNSNQNAATNNATTIFNPSSGALTAAQTIHGDSRTTLYDALHYWCVEANDATTYSDWEDEPIPRLKWEVPAASKRR